jgi:hypothetical protein
MNAGKLQSKLSMQIQDTVRASEMVLYSMADHNILGQKIRESQKRRKVAWKVRNHESL